MNTIIRTGADEICGFPGKGGTAINLFLRDLPRLSVDIDPTYLPLTPREEALPAIRQGLDAVGTDLRAAMHAFDVLRDPERCGSMGDA